MDKEKMEELIKSGMSEIEAMIREIFELNTSKTSCPVYSEMGIPSPTVKRKRNPVSIGSKIRDDFTKRKYCEAICEHRFESQPKEVDTAVTIRNHLGTCRICYAEVPVELYHPRDIAKTVKEFERMINQAKFMANYADAPDEVRKYFMVLSYLVRKFFSMYWDVFPKDDDTGLKEEWLGWDGDTSQHEESKEDEDKEEKK